MTEMQTGRPPPRVVRVPTPPPKPLRVARNLVAVLLFMAVMMVMALVWADLAALYYLTIGGAGTIYAVLWMVSRARQARRIRRARAEFLDRWPDWNKDSLAVMLAERWASSGDPPGFLDIPQLVRELPEMERQVALVICLGVVSIPAVSDRRFEPEIISPSRYWKNLVSLSLLVTVVGFGGFWCLGGFRFVEGRAPRLGWPSYAIIFVVAAGLLWMWSTVVRPEYVRIAPGVVQFLRYGFRRSNPRVRSYPLTAGTVAVMTSGIGIWGDSLAVTLIRADDFNMITLSGMRDSARAVERTWQALLSTAPTPPLSDDELVG